MALQSKEKAIDARAVRVTEFAARRALLLQVKLVKLVGPALGSAAGIARGGGINPDVLAATIQRLADNVQPESFLVLAQELLADTWIDNKEIKSDAEFDAAFSGSGGLLLLYKVLAFVLEVNFGSFFGAGGIGGLAARFGARPQDLASASPSS